MYYKCQSPAGRYLKKIGRKSLVLHPRTVNETVFVLQTTWSNGDAAQRFLVVIVCISWNNSAGNGVIGILQLRGKGVYAEELFSASSAVPLCSAVKSFKPWRESVLPNVPKPAPARPIRRHEGQTRQKFTLVFELRMTACPRPIAVEYSFLTFSLCPFCRSCCSVACSHAT